MVTSAPLAMQPLPPTRSPLPAESMDPPTHQPPSTNGYARLQGVDEMEAQSPIHPFQARWHAFRASPLPLVPDNVRYIAIGASVYTACVLALRSGQSSSYEASVQTVKQEYCQQYKTFSWVTPKHDVYDYGNLPMDLMPSCLHLYGTNQTVTSPIEGKPKWDLISLDRAGPFPLPGVDAAPFVLENDYYKQAVDNAGRSMMMSLGIRAPRERVQSDTESLCLFGLVVLSAAGLVFGLPALAVVMDEAYRKPSRLKVLLGRSGAPAS